MSMSVSSINLSAFRSILGVTRIIQMLRKQSISLMKRPFETEKGQDTALCLQGTLSVAVSGVQLGGPD